MDYQDTGLLRQSVHDGMLMYSCIAMDRFSNSQLVWTVHHDTLVKEYILYLRIMKHLESELPGVVQCFVYGVVYL